MPDPLPAYRYPDTHAERVAWHERGTPAPWSPYVPDVLDPYRDGLLNGAVAHRRAP